MDIKIFGQVGGLGFDVDKIDYIARDTHHFDLKVGIDADRIISNCRVIDDEICFNYDIYNDLYI